MPSYSYGHPLDYGFVQICATGEPEDRVVTVGSGFLISDGSICTCAHVVAAALGDVDIKRNPITPDAGVDVCFPYLHSKRVQCRISHWAGVDGLGQDAAILVPTEPIPNNSSPLAIVGGVAATGGLFETCGFKTGTSFVAHAEGRIGHSVPLGWVELIGLNAEGLFIQRGFSGAPVWSLRHQAVVGMITAVDNTEPTARLAYLIPSQMLETTLVTRMIDLCGGVAVRFDRRRALAFVGTATERPGYAGELCRNLLDLHLPTADPGERVWIYYALGEIAGEVAFAGLSRAISLELNDLAKRTGDQAIVRAARFQKQGAK